MKKIACLSALAAVLAFTAGTSVAATSTVTGGYAQSDAQGKMNKMGGFNLKYRYEEDNSPLGVIGSFTYTEKVVLTVQAITTKPSTTASPQVRHTVSMTGRVSMV